MSSIEIAQQYFELSNHSDFRAIEKLFTNSTTYSSQNTGLYLGVTGIMKMQRVFHESYSSLYWRLNSIEEIKPGIILVDYDFIGKKPDGQSVKSSIQHVEIRNKSSV